MAIQLTDREAQAFFKQINRPMPTVPRDLGEIGLSAVAASLAGLSGGAMTAESFAAWMQRHGFSDVEAAEALGCSRNTIQAYREGRTEVPKCVALACAAVSYGLPPMA